MLSEENFSGEKEKQKKNQNDTTTSQYNKNREREGVEEGRNKSCEWNIFHGTCFQYESPITKILLFSTKKLSHTPYKTNNVEDRETEDDWQKLGNEHSVWQRRNKVGNDDIVIGGEIEGWCH